MIPSFKKWFNEIRDNALATKREIAKNNGDESKWKKEIWSSPNKNRDIKAKFRDQGELLGYKSRPSYKTGAGEWLYDFVWREIDENNFLKRVVLAMEIEVSAGSIRYDFNKLLQADSEYKIMVFQRKTPEECQEVFIDLHKALEIYQAETESQYLLVGWSTSLNDFKFEEYTTKTN